MSTTHCVLSNAAVAVLIVNDDGTKVITAVHNVPLTETSAAVERIRVLAEASGFSVSAFATSNGLIVIENFGLQLDLVADIAELTETVFSTPEVTL